MMEQVKIQREIQGKGFNIITCGLCGEVNLDSGGHEMTYRDSSGDTVRSLAGFQREGTNYLACNEFEGVEKLLLDIVKRRHPDWGLVRIATTELYSYDDEYRTHLTFWPDGHSGDSVRIGNIEFR